MRDEHERSQELKELFARFDALNGDEEELKAKKAKWAGSRVAWRRDTKSRWFIMDFYIINEISILSLEMYQ